MSGERVKPVIISPLFCMKSLLFMVSVLFCDNMPRLYEFIIHLAKKVTIYHYCVSIE